MPLSLALVGIAGHPKPARAAATVTVRLVKDVKPGLLDSHPARLANAGGILFFVADDGTHGYELWRSDGTETGTVMVKDLSPGGSSGWLTDVGGTLFFVTGDGTRGFELWKSDGTEAGTVMLKGFNPADDSHHADEDEGPRELTDVAGTLFFSADDRIHGLELWKSDGSEAGTVMVKDINPGSAWSLPGDLTNVAGTLFFSAASTTTNSWTHDFQLWKSDGSEAGTVMVEDFNSDGSSKIPASLTDVDGTLFFSGTDCTHGRELWTTVVGEAPPPPTEQISHDRKVGLRRAGIAKQLARGRVLTTTDTLTKGHCGAPVRLQIRPLKGGKWRTHAQLITNRWGAFKGVVPDRRLRVRAVAPKVVLKNGHTHERAVSPVRHRR